MKIKDVANYLETIAPLQLQESYDNSGLLVGDPNEEVSGILASIDVTEAVIDEALQKNANLIVAHHPLIFSGLKKITGKNYVERTLLKAIKNDIAIYAAHTNLDSVTGGVNTKIAENMGLQNCRILNPTKGQLKKLVTFIPTSHAEKVRQAIFEAGAGHIGNYDSCSFNLAGQGTFRAGDNTHPFVGEKGALHFENEIRVETIFPAHLQNRVIHALLAAHPYEEVAYDIYPLDNTSPQTGIGIVGELPIETTEKSFLEDLRNTFQCGVIRHTAFLNKPIKKIAVCGGAGSFLLQHAIAAGADVFVTGDFKYHQFFDADGKILIADIGHFESEQFTKELFCELLIKKFPKFAVHLSEINTNPVFYF